METTRRDLLKVIGVGGVIAAAPLGLIAAREKEDAVLYGQPEEGGDVLSQFSAIQVYQAFRKHMIGGLSDWERDEYFIHLCDGRHRFDSEHNLYQALCHEIPMVNGYSPQRLETKLIDNEKTIGLGASNVCFGDCVSICTNHAVIVCATFELPVLSIQFNEDAGPLRCSMGSLNINWNDNAVLIIS